MKGFVCLLCFFSLTGCQVLQGFTKTYPEWPFQNDTLCLQGSEKGKIGAVTQPTSTYNCQSGDALKAYLTATEYCHNVYRWYERSDSNHGILKSSLGALGTLSGSVAAPLSSGTTASAWSSFSGATNALQGNVENNLSGSLAAKRTQSIMVTTEQKQNEFATESMDYTQQVFKSINLASSCAMAPAKADQAVLRAISGANIDDKANDDSQQTNNKPKPPKR